MSIKFARTLFSENMFADALEALSPLDPECADYPLAASLSCKCLFELARYDDSYNLLKKIVTKYTDLGCYDQRVAMAHIRDIQGTTLESIQILLDVHSDLAYLQSCVSNYLAKLLKQ